VFIEEGDIHFLIDIGFTKTQAKLYLTLLKLEDADANTLSEKTNIARPEIYRTLNELQKKGLVEKEINVPYKFKATPIDLGLKILIDQRLQHCEDIREKTKKFLQNRRKVKNDMLPKQNFKLIMIQGRERLKQILKPQHDSAQRTIDILTTLPRWLQILHFSFENYEKALARGVRYRVILEAKKNEIRAHENIQALLKEKNFKLRLSESPLITNAAIFDDKEVVVNFFPSQPIAKSPIIWTNHPSFISMCQDHFNAIWRKVGKSTQAVESGSASSNQPMRIRWMGSQKPASQE
jgi:sugar-specific transcriptional regulator TrmB